MKLVLATFLSFSSSAAFALDFKCEKQVSPTRVDYTRISSWPFLDVQISSKEECYPSGICHTGPSESIADRFSVCYQPVDVKRDCEINETATSMEVVCGGVTLMRFAVGLDSMGSLQCFENGVSRKSWALGTCRPQ